MVITIKKVMRYRKNRYSSKRRSFKRGGYKRSRSRGRYVKKYAPSRGGVRL